VVQNNTAINTTNTEQLNASTGLTPGRIDTGYGPGVSTTTLRQYPKGSSDPTQVLQTRYNLNNFTGDLVQYELLADSTLSPTPISSASTVTGTRTLYTSAPNQTGRLVAVPFTYNNLSTAQKATLNRNLNNIVDTKGQNRFDYLGGTRTSELASGGTLRTRTNIFGPVIDSSPVTLMKNVLTGYNDDKYPRYTEFRKKTVRRNTLSLYAANDGMLHAYKVDPTAALSQVFSFLPGTILDETAR
jgi:type IV pilus assembly protein PilY1